jgi:uncharacterized protein DUF4268
VGSTSVTLNPKQAFAQLAAQKADIETALGAVLVWRELPHRHASRIVQRQAGDISARGTWPQLHAWHKERAEVFHRVLSSRIKGLDLKDDEESADEDDR